MYIVTDFPRFPKEWRTSHTQGKASTVLAGASIRDIFKIIPEIHRADLILIHDGSNILWLVLLFWIMPFLKKPIISIDLLLQKPNTAKQKCGAWAKRIVLRRVDHFIHYFQTLDGYEKYYGISPGRSSYVPFKANLFGNPMVEQFSSKEKEEFVYVAGWSLRDYDTFFEAISQLGYPAAIPQPNFERLREHGSRFNWPLNKLPPNLTLLD